MGKGITTPNSGATAGTNRKGHEKTQGVTKAAATSTPSAAPSQPHTRTTGFTDSRQHRQKK
jgi:hypothetical protein